MTDLNREQKVFIVRALAQFCSPSEVAKLVKEEFEGLVVSRQRVRYYNPEQSAELDQEWKDLFYKERERAIADVNDVGTAHKSVRLRELDAMYRRAKAMGAIGLAADLLEQIAKEEGGAFTNRREHTGAGGGAIDVEIVATVADYRDATSALAPPDEAPKAAKKPASKPKPKAPAKKAATKAKPKK